jgi:hypothetical protein
MTFGRLGSAQHRAGRSVRRPLAAPQPIGLTGTIETLDPNDGPLSGLHRTHATARLRPVADLLIRWSVVS